MTQKEFTRKSLKILALAFLLLVCMAWNTDSLPRSDNGNSQTDVHAAAKDTDDDAEAEDVQAVWISFGDYKAAGLYNKSKTAFASNASTYFKKLKKDGINTIYFHVVPCNDAIYPSKYLKWSSYMFSSAPDYDPLAILIKAAHDNNMSLHAWLNPYRKKMGVIFNPGKASSLNRIDRIVKEIIQNYDVDGIHFDDYFYPSKAKGEQFYNVSVSKRKQVINKMIRTVYKTVKAEDKSLQFGISPAGNTEYAESLGCDLKTWMSEDGYMDYIIPQIYWSDQYRLNGKITSLYSDRLEEWTGLNMSGMPMYIGLALYRAGSSDSNDPGWKRRDDNIVTQIKKAKKADCEGFVLFSSAYMYSSRTGKEMTNYRKYIKNNGHQ